MARVLFSNKKSNMTAGRQPDIRLRRCRWLLCSNGVGIVVKRSERLGRGKTGGNRALTRETEDRRLEVLLVPTQVDEGHAAVAVVHHLRPSLQMRPRRRHNL